MSIERYQPPSDLSMFFREYYYCEIRSEESTFIPVVDDGCHDLVFFLERDSRLEYGKEQKVLPIDKGLFTIHALQPPYRILINKSLSFFTIKVQPWYNAAFFPVGPQVGIVAADAFFPEYFEELHSKIFKVPVNEQRFELANEGLRKMLSNRNPEPDILVQTLCERIYKHKGIITVSELEDTLGVSRQHLNARFRSSVYYSLKNFIIIVRILDLIKRKINAPDLSFTALAHEYHYFDQAHFNRDFKRVTGLTPGRFFKDLAPFFERHRL